MDCTDQESNHINATNLSKQEQVPKRFKYAIVIGSLILVLPNNFTNYWGNLSVYSLSFLVQKHKSMTGAETSWAFSTCLIFWTTATILSALLAKRIGHRSTILIGALISDVGMFISYLAVQDTMLTLTVTSGLMTGLGTGLIDSTALQLVVLVADKDSGKLTSGILASRAFGALFINQITTFYLNPNNLSPDLHIPQGNVFTQDKILSKVPMFFLFLGGISAGCHCVGLSVLSYKRKTKISILQATSRTCPNDNIKRPIGRNLKDDSKTERFNNDGEISKEQIVDKTSQEMMKSKTFYALWIIYFLGAFSSVLHGNYYKAFGLIWIPDDRFLTDIGTAMVATRSLSMSLTGIVIDKYGFKKCLIVYISLLALIQQWYYLMPILNKWLFMVASFICSGLIGGSFSAIVAAVVFLFGKKHYSGNVAIVMTAPLACNAISIFSIDFLLSSLLWSGTFTLASVLNLVRLVITILLIPQT